MNNHILRLNASDNKTLKSKSLKSASSKQAKLNQIRKEIELKKLMLEQEQEVAKYRLELEKQRIECEQKMKTCELKYNIQIAEKEAQFLEQADSDASLDDLEEKEKVDLLPPFSIEEKVSSWAAKLEAAPLNADAPKFIPNSSEVPIVPDPKPEPKYYTGEKSLGPHPKEPMTREAAFSASFFQNQAVMLKLTMLQAMQPVKFSGDPSDFPTFRNSVKDNLEDGILLDSQRVEFLPKFLFGDAYDVVQRVSGCSYQTIMGILEDRFGQPANVAAACIANLIKGPKLQNQDYAGLRNFAEQLESAAKKLSGNFELEASTNTNLRQIIRRLPGYLINKWADVSFSIRESGRDPRLGHLAEFVKRQAAIKNEPGFVSADRNENRNALGKQSGSNKSDASHKNRTTMAFVTDASPQNSQEK